MGGVNDKVVIPIVIAMMKAIVYGRVDDITVRRVWESWLGGEEKPEVKEKRKNKYS